MSNSEKEKPGLFIRVPKNASTSILNCLRDNDLRIKHTSIESLGKWKRRSYPPGTFPGVLYAKTGRCSRLITLHSNFVNLEDVYSFGFVRNPYERVVSSYYLHSNDQLINYWASENPSTWHRPENFKDYLRFLLTQDLNPDAIFSSEQTLLAGAQYPFLIDEERKIRADFIGKVENLQDDLSFVCEKIGVPNMKVPHVNKTNHKHYTEYYDKEAVDIVSTLYQRDIEIFDYKFGQ